MEILAGGADLDVVERDLLAPSVTWTRFGEDIDVTLISAYQDWEILETADFDFSSMPTRREKT